jgi:hypothetical protein
MLTTNEVLDELSKIIRGEHPGWKGDRIRNAEGFLWRIGQDFDEAAAIADDIERNIADCSDYCGMSPNGLRASVNRIRESITRAHINGAPVTRPGPFSCQHATRATRHAPDRIKRGPD